jgi:phytoene synthase
MLMKAGIATTDPVAAVGDPRVDGACRELAAQALDHFVAADRLLRSRPRGRLLAPRLMSAVYRTLLQEMLAEGWAPPRRRVRIAKPRLLWIVVRCSVFGR